LKPLCNRLLSCASEAFGVGCPRRIFDHYRLTQLSLELIGDHATHCINRSSRGIRDDHFYGPVRIVLSATNLNARDCDAQQRDSEEMRRKALEHVVLLSKIFWWQDKKVYARRLIDAKLKKPGTSSGSVRSKRPNWWQRIQVFAARGRGIAERYTRCANAAIASLIARGAGLAS